MTRHHLGNLEHWRQRSDIEQKEKYIDVEDTASPRGLLLMGHDASLSFMKRGLYLDRTHARSRDLSKKKKKKKGIGGRKSHDRGTLRLGILLETPAGAQSDLEEVVVLGSIRSAASQGITHSSAASR